VKNYSLRDDIIPATKDLISLYEDVGWNSYTENPSLLKKSLNNSLKVWTIWDEKNLIGLGRVVGDNYSIIYIQDLLILKAYQGQGLGSKLLGQILKSYEDVRQIVLLTDNNDTSVNFYEKNGLKEVSSLGSLAFMK
jgi:ribosomal protein S18 acetylase RimI-like enzyme